MPTHARAERLRALLESLRAQTLGADAFEVIVVDDASDDDGATRALLAGAHELQLRAVHRERSGGPGAARNEGWRLARAPLVAFIDDDCRAEPGWLAAGVAAADATPGAIVQGRTELAPEDAGRLGPTVRQFTVRRLGPWYETANIFYPRELLERLGGFDADSLPGYGEDTDLAWRAIAQGAETVWAPDALVFHAIQDVGWLGQLRGAMRWTPLALVYKRHPAFRRAATHKRVFWKWQHYFLVRWLLAQALRRRAPALAFFLALPYNRYLLTDRSRGARWWHAPYILALDLAELGAVARGALRYRVLVL